MTKVIFVCVANYCRSPVAEYLLKALDHKDLEVSSAGIDPINTPSMDPRSKKYLLDMNIEVDIHEPKKISFNLAAKADIIFALDYDVYLNLKKIFTKSNIKMINLFDSSIMTPDPYKYKNIDDYNLCMDNIQKSIYTIYQNANKL